MTTNVYDSTKGLMTTDSRWSVRHGDYLIFIDDARFEKIERYEDAVFMFAGNGQKIQAWKTWIRSRPADQSGMPPCEQMCVCIARFSTRDVLFAERQDIVRNGGHFAGSGSRFAFECWERNACARQAVESAKQFDYLSGGDVKFVDFTSGEHNLFSLANDVQIGDVGKALAIRGNVMKIAVNSTSVAQPPFKLADLAANDADLQDVQARIASGDVSPTAPCDGMYSEWTDAHKSKLTAVLSDVFGWTKQN